MPENVWRSRLDLAAAIVMLIVAAVALWQMSRWSPASRQGSELPPGPFEIEGLMSAGASGPRAILLFSDFQCPFCIRFANDEWSILKAKMTSSAIGTIRFVHFPLASIHPLATIAAEAVECARNHDKGWEVHDQLFALSAASGFRDRASVFSAVRMAMGDATRLVEACVADGRRGLLVRSQVELGQRLGVKGTPTFVLGTLEDAGFYPKRVVRGATTADVLLRELELIAK